MSDKVLFTSDEEAEKAGYVRLSSKWYNENEFALADEVTDTFYWDTILIDDSIDTSDGYTFHMDSEDDYFTCDDCDDVLSCRNNSYTHTHHWDDVCDRCLDNYIYCDDNDEWYERDYFYSNGWRYDADRDIHTFEEEEDEDYSGCLKWYHSDYGADEDKTTQEDRVKFGMELEKWEICGDESRHQQYRRDGWRTEEDCTVKAEYITPILSLSRMDDSIKWMMDTANSIVDGDINYKCGWHIHISVKDISCIALYEASKYFMPLFWALYPERAINDYSFKPNAMRWRGRRDIETHPDIETVEFRIFPWCKGEKTLRFRLTLMKAIIDKSSEWAVNSTGSYREAVEFIKNSTDIMKALSIVYDTPEKISSLVERIIPSYNEAIQSGNENYKLTRASAFAKKLEKFVENKVPENIIP